MIIDCAHDMMIGLKWLHEHDAHADVKNRRLVFPEEREQVRQRIAEPERTIRRLQPEGDGPARPTIPEQWEAAGHTAELAKIDRALRDLPLPATTEDDRPSTQSRPRAAPEQLRDIQGPYELRRDAIGWYKHRPPNIALIGATAFLHITKRAESQAFVTSLNELDHYILEEKRRLQGLSEDEPELQEKVLRDVPACYHEYADVFSKAISDDLAERQSYDHKIELTEGGRPEDLGYSPLRKMTLEEMEACKKYITENLDKGFIEASSSPWAAPILFSRKADGGLRFCVDYRRLNAITKKDRYPLPLIDETLTRVSKAKIFSKIDIRQAFHKIRIDPEHETLTTFRTRYGAYKYRVMPFGLTNGPATFQRFINDTEPNSPWVVRIPLRGFPYPHPIFRNPTARPEGTAMVFGVHLAVISLAPLPGKASLGGPVTTSSPAHPPKLCCLGLGPGGPRPGWGSGGSPEMGDGDAGRWTREGFVGGVLRPLWPWRGRRCVQPPRGGERELNW